MKPTLLLIDLQSDFLAAAGLQPSAPVLVANATELLAACRKRGVPVIHVWTTVERTNDRRLPHWRQQNRWLCVAGTPGHSTPETLRPLPGEPVINKTGFNPFAGDELEKALRACGSDAVIIGGLHLHACVRTAAVESLERGFQVHIAEPAVASYDPIHSAATRRWLAERCVTFESIAAVLSRCDGKVSTKWLHHSPHDTAKILFEATNSTADEVKQTAVAASDAFHDWQRMPMTDRAAILEKVAVGLKAAADELAHQMAVEIGKPIRHAHEEIHRAAASIRDVAHRAAGLSAPRREPAGWVRREPLGVIGIISAWNNPAAIPLGKIAPALAYGNTVVWKPAPAATAIARTLMRLFQEAGLPDGVVGLVTGDQTVAQRVAADELVSAVTLTGSLAAGHALQEICARRIVPFQAELSGNNAAIVWEDADLAAAAAQVAWGAFAFAGQRCTANRRVIVQASQFENFLRELESATARLPWGDPLEQATEIGPLIHADKRAELESLVAGAEASGAAHRTVRPHATRAGETWVRAGAYAQPVIVGCDEPGHALVQEETMSPMLVVQRADDFDHALALCNGVRHGLIAALFSRSDGLQDKFLQEAHAGILKFNSTTAGVDVTLPFGGWKASGLGPPEHGEGDVQFYTRMQAVYGRESFS